MISTSHFHLFLLIISHISPPWIVVFWSCSSFARFKSVTFLIQVSGLHYFQNNVRYTFFTFPLSHSFITLGTSFIYSPFFNLLRIISVIFFPSPYSFSHPLLPVKVVHLFIISLVNCSTNYNFWGTRECTFHAVFPSAAWTYRVPSPVFIYRRFASAMHLLFFLSLSLVPIISI